RRWMMVILGGAIAVQSVRAQEMPRLVQEQGHATLMVDGKPFFVLGAQVEPEKGRFDFTVVDAILEQAREHQVRLVMLWFGTWKNGKMHYVPEWVKSDTATYPRMKSKAGVAIDVLSPNAPANMEADSRAFAALMRHLKETDPQHTVIMMQVEN